MHRLDQCRLALSSRARHALSLTVSMLQLSEADFELALANALRYFPAEQVHARNLTIFRVVDFSAVAGSHLVVVVV